VFDEQIRKSLQRSTHSHADVGLTISDLALDSRQTYTARTLVKVPVRVASQQRYSTESWLIGQFDFTTYRRRPMAIT